MENHAHPLHINKVLPRLSNKVPDGNGSAKLHYEQMFGWFHKSCASSIPALNLPLVEEKFTFFDVRSSDLDYGDIFGGMDGLDFAASYEDLLMDQFKGGRGASSDETRSPAKLESLSEGSDHSRKNQSLNGDIYESIDGNKEFIVLSDKPSQRRDLGRTKGPGVIAVDETSPFMEEFENPHILPDDRILGSDYIDAMEGRYLKQTLSHLKNGNAGGMINENGIKHQRKYTRSNSCPNEVFVSVAEISLRTHPSEVPPPSRPPPALDIKQRDSCVSTTSCASEGSECDSSSPFFDEEIDISSAATASAAAVKNHNALEQDQIAKTGSEVGEIERKLTQGFEMEKNLKDTFENRNIQKRHKGYHTKEMSEMLEEKYKQVKNSRTLKENHEKRESQLKCKEANELEEYRNVKACIWEERKNKLKSASEGGLKKEQQCAEFNGNEKIVRMKERIYSHKDGYFSVFDESCKVDFIEKMVQSAVEKNGSSQKSEEAQVSVVPEENELMKPEIEHTEKKSGATEMRTVLFNRESVASGMSHGHIELKKSLSEKLVCSKPNHQEDRVKKAGGYGVGIAQRRRERKRNETPRPEEKEAERVRQLEKECLRGIDGEQKREREKERIAADRINSEAHDRKERAPVERLNTEARPRTPTRTHERLEKVHAEARENSGDDQVNDKTRLRAQCASVERITAEDREHADENFDFKDYQFQRTSSISSRYTFSSSYGGIKGESAQRCKARLERHRRTAERAAKALAEKITRDLAAQREQEERNRLAQTLDADVKRWSSGKEGNVRALVSTLQYILGSNSGWQPIPLTAILTPAAVKKAYKKATLCVHPDKLQQRNASIQQKYICEKVYDLLKEAWTKFNSEEP